MSADAKNKSLFERLISMAGKPSTSRIYDSGRTTPPDEVRKHLNAEDGDSLLWFKIPGPFALVKKAACIAIMVAVFFVPSSLVYAQEVPPPTHQGPPPGEQAPLNYGPVITGPNPFGLATEPYKLFTGPTAYYPLQINLIMPSGGSIIGNASSLLTTSKYDLLVGVGRPYDGQTTLSFTTTYADRFDVTMGQEYRVLDTSVPQYAILTVTANGTKTHEELILIEKSKFYVHIIAETSSPPHFPTAAELQSVNAEFFSTLINQGNRIEGLSEETNRNVSSAANGFRLSTVGMIFLALIVTPQTIVSFLLYQRFSSRAFPDVNRKREDSRGSSVNRRGDNRPPPTSPKPATAERGNGPSATPSIEPVAETPGQEEKPREPVAQAPMEEKPPATIEVPTTELLPEEDPDSTFDKAKERVMNSLRGRLPIFRSDSQ